MFKAANKDSSPATSITPTPGGTTCLSSQAATLRLTPEGLNIVGGALAAGKLTSSLKDQQQKFFATRSADGNWNLLMTRPSDPSRLFLVKPAPGHKFQMTGGKVRMENMDSASEVNSAGESSTNGCGVDPPSQISSSETEEQTPGTSKSIAVPVAQLWTPSTVNPLSAAQTQAVCATNVQTTAATETVNPCSVPEKKRTFFKTAKDRRAQKAAAEQALGKKTHGKTRKGGRSPGATTKQVKGVRVLSSDSCQSQMSSKTLRPSSEGFISPRHSSATSTTQNSSPASILDHGQMTCNFDSCLHVPPARSQSRDNTSTLQSHTENKTAGDEVCQNTVERDTESRVFSDPQNLGEFFENKTKSIDPMLNSSVQSSVTDKDAKAGEPSENHNDSQDEQITVKPCSSSDVGIHSPTDKGSSPQQNSCQNEHEEDQPGRCSTNPFGSKDEKSPKPASTGVPSRKNNLNKSCERDSELNTGVEDDELASDCKLPNSHKTVKKTSEMSKPSSGRRLQKTPEKNEYSSFSSDTDDYEFVPSDSEKQTKTRGSNRKVSAQHHFSAASSVPDMVPRDGFGTEDVEKLQHNPTTQKEELQQNPATQKAFYKPITQKVFAAKKRLCSVVDEQIKRIFGDSGSPSTCLKLKTAFGGTYSEQQCVSGKKGRKSDENVWDSSGDVQVLQSKQCNDPESVEESKTSSDPDAHCDSRSEENSHVQTTEEVTDKTVEEGIAKVGKKLSTVGQGETYPESIKTSSTLGDIAPETCKDYSQSARRRGEGCHEVDQYISDILQQKPPAENRANTENHELKPEQNKAKKRKKRKSEVENLGAMAVVETGPHCTSEDAGVCEKSKEQEPVSEMAIRRPTVSYSPKQRKKAHGKKRQIKFCINLNKGKLLKIASGEEAMNDVSSLESVSPSTQNIASSKLASDCETGNGSHCLSHAEQELSKSKENNIEPLPSENQVTSPQSTETEHVCVPDIENQNGRNGKKCLTLLCPEENSRKKRKKKKLKSLVRNNLVASAPEIATSANTDSCSPSDLDSLPKNHPDDSITNSETVTEFGLEVRKQTASTGSVPQKKKRKKRLNELETLIHDQEAYVVHDSKQSIKEVSDSKDDTAQETTEQEEIHPFDLTEVDRNEGQNEAGKADNSLSKMQECKRTSLKVSESAEAVESAEVVDDLVSGNNAKLPSSSADLPAAASEQKPNKKKASEQQPKTDGVKRKYKRKKKKIPTAGVIVMPPVAPRTEPDPTAIDCRGKEASENTDLNSSFSSDNAHFDEPEKAKDISNVTDSEDEEAKSNKAMEHFLTSRSFCKWELERMFGTPFVVLERLCDQDINFMKRRFRKARERGRARCSAHCRLRTLDCLCTLDLINCKPPPVPRKKASEVQKDGASEADGESPSKQRKKKNKEGCEKDEDGRKRKKRGKHLNEQRSGGDVDGDVIIVDESTSKTPNTATSSQGTGTVTSSASSMPSFPSATFGRFRLKQLGPQTKSVAPRGVSPSQVTTSAGPRFIIPSMAANTGRPSSVHQIFTIPSFGSVSRPPSVPQVLTLSSLGNTISSANRILIPPLVVNSSSSLRDATRASLTQAISNSLCKTRLVTPGSAAPVVALTQSPVPAQSASMLQKGPIVVQTGVVTQSSSMLPKGPIIVTVAPPSAPVLGKGPQVVQSTMASSTAPATQGSAGAPKQFFVVQMGDKRVLVPAAALGSTAATPITTSSTLSGVTTVAATPRPLLQSSVHLGSVGQQSAGPAPTVITAPATAVRHQAASLVPGSMARIVLSNRPTITVAPTTGPTASTLLFASRPGVGAGPRPNQAWSGPRTVDSNRRVMVTPSPGGQPQGVRVVLAGTAGVNSATRFAVSTSRGGVVVASRQPNSLVRAASPRQSRPGKRVMTEEERLRKRARLEKKYPLPPGVVIKTEPQSRGYSDEGKTTQANSSARVFVSTVPAGSASRTQVNLTQPIPVLSAFRGNPIIIRQAVPANASIPRPASLLSPLIIRMPNASASTVTSSTSAPCATSTVTAMAATSLLTSSRVSNTATSTVPLRYSLLSGNTVVTAGSVPSSSVVVRPSASLVSPLTATQSRSAASSASVVNISSAPSQTSSASNGSVQAASDSQQNNSEDDAIYIADSPSPAPPASESAADSHSAAATENVPEVSSASLEMPDVDLLPCTAATSATVSATVASSQIPTTVVYTSQSPIMFTSASSSTSSSSGPSSRMASLGAMWVRQAAASPNSMPAIDTRSLQSERMQRLKEMLAKQMENIGDERRQKALQALHQQFCQGITAENTEEDISPSVTATTDNNDQSASGDSCELLDVSDSDHQYTETASDACGTGQTDPGSDQSVKDMESAGSASGENRDCAEGRTSVDRAEAEVDSDSVVLDTELDSGDQDSVVAQPPILEVDDASFLDGNVLMVVDEEEERAVLAMHLEENSESAENPNSDGGEMSEGNGAHEQGETVPSGAVDNDRQTDNDTDNQAGTSDSNVVCPDEPSECDKDMRDTSNTPEGNSDGDAPVVCTQDTDNAEMDCTELSNDVS